ncbi:MAG: TRAP transporter small permease subunit [Gammaproteobacteria bacterium]|nr:TRAP transporter small permease subunit [Gammaproteobacteria bacterium]MDE0650167.1 TRAP transporter small permease subunit [Gammaproteobacteria bacterium]MXW10627.1 TRAP transporter small permease subunit [Gammaproteobacteria bacterium]MYC53871.1 TRAP transporter small permease subunit [Gammaproteobacteria bacterium]
MTAFDQDPAPDRSPVDEALRRWLTAAVAVTGGVALLLLLGVTVVEVVARHLFGAPLLGAEDLTSMGLTVLVAAAVVCAAQEGTHVSVELIERFAGRRVTRATDALARVLGAAAAAVTAFALFANGSCGIECGEVTGTIAIMHTPFYYALGACMATYSLLLASRLIQGRASREEDDSRARGI